MVETGISKGLGCQVGERQHYYSSCRELVLQGLLEGLGGGGGKGRGMRWAWEGGVKQLGGRSMVSIF